MLPLSGLTVNQLLPTFTPRDAMGTIALNFQRVLASLGAAGNVYAGEVTSEFRSVVRDATALEPSRESVLLYHHGIASEWAGRLLHMACRRVVVFHNVTPARFAQGTRLEGPLIAGRAQLAAMADGVDRSIGVSQFNANELIEAGHRSVVVVPPVIEAQRWSASEADRRLADQLATSGRPLMLSVSRVVPHKRVEDLLALHREVRRLAPDAQLRIVGPLARGSTAVRALLNEAKHIGGVTLTGDVSHAELVALYRSADVYVSMSEHEGFGVPLIEAMAADVPVLAFAAAAVPETLAGAGISFDTKHFAALAEVVVLLRADEALRQRVLESQRTRVNEFSFERCRVAMAEALVPFARAPVKRAKQRARRIGVVVQRFGANITGGAELHARQIAERLAQKASVEVFTSRAVDHLTWNNVLPEGTELDGELRVHRFSSLKSRTMRAFNALSKKRFGIGNDAAAELHWLAEQGPILEGLTEALRSRRDEFDAFVFFTALYAPTVWGLPLVGDKAILVPTLHDEPPMRFHLYDEVFERPQIILCNTEHERAFLNERFRHAAHSEVVGVGLEAPTKLDTDAFREKFRIRGPYLFYVGRVEAGKNVPALLKAHRAMVERFHDAPTLVLAGDGGVQVSGERVVTLGRISEEDKWNGLAGALATPVPSLFESLSLLTIESLAAGTPVVGHRDSPVVADHVERSEAGALFHDSPTFAEAVQHVGTNRAALSARGKRYARRFQWNTVMKAYWDAIDRISPRSTT